MLWLLSANPTGYPFFTLQYGAVPLTRAGVPPSDDVCGGAGARHLHQSFHTSFPGCSSRLVQHICHQTTAKMQQRGTTELLKAIPFDGVTAPSPPPPYCPSSWNRAAPIHLVVASHQSLSLLDVGSGCVSEISRGHGHYCNAAECFESGPQHTAIATHSFVWFGYSRLS